MDQIDLASLIVDDRSRGVFRIDQKAFSQQTVLDAERDQLFSRVWLYAAHESELPLGGGFLSRNVAGRPIILTRDEEGQIHGLFNACSHRGNALCRARSGRTRLLTCNYHAWAFNLKGELVAQPGAEAYSPAAQDRSELGLRRVPRVENYRGMIFVSFQHDIIGLVEYLAGAREYLDLVLDYADELEVPAGEQMYSINANWKLLVENSFDGYHALPMHRRYFADFMSEMGFDSGSWTAPGEKSAVDPDYFGRSLSLGNGHAAVVSPARSNPLETKARRELDAVKDRLVAKYGAKHADLITGQTITLLLFPNTMVISLWRTIRTFYPVRPNFIDVSAWGLMPRGESAELRQMRLENFLSFLGPGGFGTPDDIMVLERCQQGFGAIAREAGWSDVSRGMLSARPNMNDELQMRAFWRQWHHMIQGKEGAANCRDADPMAAAAE